jgi:hypothetical protein
MPISLVRTIALCRSSIILHSPKRQVHRSPINILRYGTLPSRLLSTIHISDITWICDGIKAMCTRVLTNLQFERRPPRESNTGYGIMSL